MHVIKGSWSGQAFALANSHDSVGRKSRIWRSKEERKAMVESFIKKYQKSNNGKFPSLNLAHKEVGGSFYTVREIFREIIQENRVLAPPKISSEEYSNQEFLEQHPLGPISMEPQIDSSISGSIHVVTHIVPPKNQIINDDNSSASSEQLNGSLTFKLDNEQLKGISEVADNSEGFDRNRKDHQALNDYLINYDGEIVNGVEILEESSHFDKPVVSDIDREDSDDSALLSSQEFDGQGSGILTDEQYNKNDETVDKNKEFAERINVKSAITEILDKERYGGRDVETFETVNSHVNSSVVVETFPLRPVPRMILDMDGDSGKLQEADGSLEAIEGSLSFANAKDGKEFLDEKALLNPQTSSSPEVTVPVGFDIGGEMTELESGHASPNGTSKVSTKRPISEDSTLAESKASDENSGSYPEGKTPPLNRINLETWEGTSKKSTRLEKNPLLAIVKAFISSFVKFWTE